MPAKGPGPDAAEEEVVPEHGGIPLGTVVYSRVITVFFLLRYVRLWHLQENHHKHFCFYISVMCMACLQYSGGALMNVCSMHAVWL